MISREIINKDIVYKDFFGTTYEYENICERINQAKHFMLDRGVEKESLIAIVDITPTINLIALLFASFELGAVVTISHDELWRPETSDRWMDGLFDYNRRTNRWGISSIITFSALDEDIIDGMKKGDVYNGIGFKLIKNMTNVVPIRDIDNYPKTDIQPWEVTEDDLCCQTTSKVFEEDWTPELHTHSSVYNKVSKVVDIFGYRNKRVALTKNHGHLCALELLILPSLMSSSLVVDIPLPDNSEGVHEKILKASNLLIKKHKIDLLFGVNDAIYPHLSLPEFTKVLKYNDNVYGDMESLPKVF